MLSIGGVWEGPQRELRHPPGGEFLLLQGKPQRVWLWGEGNQAEESWMPPPAGGG